jgi:hypothetical protein
MNRANANVGPAAAPSAGLEIEYNHDLDVAEPFLAVYPSIRDALRDPRLLERFQFFDKVARSHKRSFQLLGLWSLLLGLVPLSTAALRMTIGEAVFARVGEINIASELCGLASVSVMLWSRRKRHRVLWCLACFWRERLRQWHFQRFLDGRLIGMLANNRAEYDRELGRRWGKLEQNFHDGYGTMVEFMRYASHGSDFYHPLTEYEDPQVREDVLGALWTLRFEHQLRFSRRKIEPEGEQTGFSLEERTELSETVATVSLAGAIVMSALAFFVSGVHLFASASPFPLDPMVITRILGGISLLLAVLSAASRAYRAGFTLPDESESYEEYCDRVRELKAVFENLQYEKDKLREVEQLEEEAAAELRRFLRMKTRATFVS